MTHRPVDPRRVLIVRPSALGDVARTVPALVALKRAFPAAEIDWLVRDSFAEVITGHPDLHEAIPFPRQRFRGFGRKLGVTREVIAYLRQLRDRRYDAVYDLQGLSRSGWITWSTRAPHRVGPADAREMAWLGYTKRVSVPADIEHTVDRMMGVIEGDGIATRGERDMRLHVPLPDRAWVEAWMQRHGLVSGSFAVIAPTARWLSKRWPIDRFAAVARRLPELGLSGCVVVASKGEEEQTAPLLQAVPAAIDLTGQTTVGQLMAVLDRAGLLVANDSAALHIATGLGRRSVSIFGPTDPAKVGPYRYGVGIVAADRSPGMNYRDTTDQSAIASIPVDRVWLTAQRVMQFPPPLTVHGEKVKQ